MADSGTLTPLERTAYRLSQNLRLGWFSAQYALSRRFTDKVALPEHLKAAMPSARELAADRQQLFDRDLQNIEAGRYRLLDAGCTDKTDPHDARAAAIVALRHGRLRQVTPVDHTAVLRLLADRHHDLTGLRTQAICRLHALLCGLTPGGAGRLLSASQAGRMLRGVRSSSVNAASVV